MNMTPKELLDQNVAFSPREAAYILRCSAQHVLNMIRDGKMDSVRFGKRHIIPRNALMKILGET